LSSVQTVTQVLGWCTVLNMGMLMFASLVLIVAGEHIKKIHAGMFGLSEDDLSRAYFQYLAQYKIAIFVFNLAPYVALKLSE